MIFMFDTKEKNLLKLNGAPQRARGPLFHGPWSRELQALLAIGAPMGLTQLVQFSVNTIDILMIGRLGAEPLAGSSLGLVIFYTTFLAGLGPALAVTPLVSQALGANRESYSDARISVRMGLWTVFLGFPLMLLFYLSAEKLALALGQPEALARLAGPYVLALGPSLPFMLGVIILRNFLAAIGRTLVPLLIILFTTVENGALNYLLIYGHWGMPRLELVGAGLASAISHATGFMMIVAYIFFERRAAKFEIFKNLLEPHWDRMREILRLGWPIGLASAFEALLFNAAVFLMGRIGVDEVAAYQVALNICALAFMMPLGIAMAGGVRVGLAKGAGDLAGVRRAAVVTIGVSIAFMVLFWLPVMAAPHAVSGFYLNAEQAGNAEVLALVISFLPIAAAFAVFDATQVAAMQCLRGLKDVRIPMAIAGLAYWLVGFPISAGLGLMTPMASAGVWWGLLVALGLAAGLLSARLYWLTRSDRPAGAAAAQLSR